MFSRNGPATFSVIILMMTQMSPKVAVFFRCEGCDYSTCKSSDYYKHLRTRKHLLNDTNDDKKVAETNPLVCTSYRCPCGKQYRYRQGLSVHRKKCTAVLETSMGAEGSGKGGGGGEGGGGGGGGGSVTETTMSDMSSSPAATKFVAATPAFTNAAAAAAVPTDLQALTHLVMNVVQQNQELVQHNMQLTEKLMQHHQRPPPPPHHITNHIQCHSKTFNINVFLDEQCKDAMNISDFMDSLEIQLTDLENLGRLGYVDGIAQIILKHLKSLDVRKRPLHCSDVKRDVMYIRDQNQWQKDNVEHPKLRHVIRHVATRNCQLLPAFREKHPNCNSQSSSDSDHYQRVVVETLGGAEEGAGEDKDKKIIRKIAKEVSIDREVLTIAFGE